MLLVVSFEQDNIAVNRAVMHDTACRVGLNVLAVMVEVLYFKVFSQMMRVEVIKKRNSALRLKKIPR